MKIFFCLKHFLPGQVAGTEIYVAALARGLIKSGHEVAVVKPNYAATGFTSYEYEGIPVLEYPESPLVNKAIQTGRSFPAGVGAFTQLLKDQRPDLIHFHEISGSNGITVQHVREAHSLAIQIFTTLHLIRYVCKTSTLLYKNKYDCDGVIKIFKCATCTLHERGFKSYSANVAGAIGMLAFKSGWRMDRKDNILQNVLNYPRYIKDHQSALFELCSLSEKVVVLNNWFREILIKNGIPANKMVSIPQAIPVQQLSDQTTYPKTPGQNNIRLVYIGRICEIKGLRLLLEVFNTIDNLNASLDIYGNVTEPAYYEDCKKLAGNNKNISWHGVAAPQDIIAIIQQYDLLVFPSIIQEMSPFTLLESFAANVPVLAADVYASRELVQEGINGWLFKTNDIHSLREKLAGLLNEPALLQKVKMHIDSPPAFSEVIAAHEHLYSQMVSV